jgi:dTDP-4-amino-4,6-dideoxygalactose transaminase
MALTIYFFYLILNTILFPTPEENTPVKVPFFDLKSQFSSIEGEIKSALDGVFKTQQFILGPEVENLERLIAQYCRSRYAVGVASGSDALILSLMALGIGAGDEVLLPPFTFFATAGAVSRLGAIPVFADIDETTYNIDPSQIEAKITPRTKAIIPVHLFGQCADMDPILRVARAKGISVIEDAAQALGAEYCTPSDSTGRRAGQIGDLGCFSFYPTKNLGAFGDGGMVVSNDPGLAERVRILRVHGSQPKYIHKWIGMNSRLDSMQAAILGVKFKHLEAWTQERQRKAEAYRLMFQDLLPSVPEFRLPTLQYKNRHIFHQYVIRAPERKQLRQFLSDAGVGTDIYYPLPLHLQECYSFLKYRPGDLPVSEKACEEVLALPIYPELTDDQQMYVVDRVKSFYTTRGKSHR